MFDDEVDDYCENEPYNFNIEQVPEDVHDDNLTWFRNDVEGTTVDIPQDVPMQCNINNYSLLCRYNDEEEVQDDSVYEYRLIFITTTYVAYSLIFTTSYAAYRRCSQAAPPTSIGISSEQPTASNGLKEDARVRKACGATRMAEVWNLEEGELIPTQFNNMGQPVGVEGGVFGQFAGSITCVRSQRGKQSSSLQTSLHTEGSRSFVRHTYEMEKEKQIAIDRTVLYKTVHSRSYGTPMNVDAAEKIEILCNESATSQPSRQSRTEGTINWSPSDAYAQVLGPEQHGRIRGVGLGPTPSSNSTNTCIILNQSCFSVKQLLDKQNQMQNKIDSLESTTQSLQSTIQSLQSTMQSFVQALAVNRDAQNVAHPKQVPSIPRSAHASTNDLGATLDANAGAGASASDDNADKARAAKD
ncbi:hypothetical protein CJ030_MR7G017844 [Morella rubra]|uniref:Uncharacterized protein n=1 Tax=Morella rubra TaxID=262757 RepID=A0A6A1UZ57_9ROSI|nr:hypothetical protein CJ030_MR7G017844 [Morella rubra]